MSKKLKISLIVIAILIVAFGLIFIAGKDILPSLLGNNTQTNISNISTSTADQKLLNKKAPSFDLPDNLKGRVDSSKFLNSPLVIIFWSTWNQDSIDQLKIVDDYISQNKGKNSLDSLVSFLAIDSQEDPSVADSFINRSGYSVPFALDAYGDVSEAYNIKSLPTMYFIDSDGIVNQIYTGILSQNMIENGLEQLLKK